MTFPLFKASWFACRILFRILVRELLFATSGIYVVLYILIDVKFLSTSVVVTGVELSDSSQGSSEHLVVYFTYLGIYWVVFNFCPKQAHGPSMASILFIPNVFPLIVCANIILISLFFPGKDN